VKTNDSKLARVTCAYIFPNETGYGDGPVAGFSEHNNDP
jgi:hypothetical protein